MKKSNYSEEQIAFALKQAYQVVCGSYDSGVVYGTTKVHRVPKSLPGDETQVKVRAQANNGF
jgi:hypothetical protein